MSECIARIPQRVRSPEDAAARFWARVNKVQPLGCWQWMGHISPAGYGRYVFGGRAGGRAIMAHRISLMLVGISVPDGYEVDHLCRNRACVNPDHLDVVPHQVNVSRGLVNWHNKIKTHCPEGHAYDYIRPDGARGCKICRLKASREHKQAKRRKSA